MIIKDAAERFNDSAELKKRTAKRALCSPIWVLGEEMKVLRREMKVLL